MPTVDRGPNEEKLDSVDNLIISLRAFMTRAPTKSKKAKKGVKAKRSYADPRDRDQEHAPPDDWVLVFDCETRTSPDQRLRFGAYQLRYKGKIWERGAFYEPEILSRDEQRILLRVLNEEIHGPDGERIRLRTRANFVDKIFYDSGYSVGGQIVGFNLPFDLSRLAIRHASARRGMRGGFSLVLSERRPPVAVKHLSQQAALIRITGPQSAKEDETDETDLDAPHEIEKNVEADGGYFVDLKTLAGALTGQSHSLESLSAFLKVPTPKEPSADHGDLLRPEYVHYALRDVQTTWECFDALARKFETFGLKDTGLYDLYSEASLGKAYLKTMNVKPWREVQPYFLPQLMGHILSAYFGGRSEVHIRRQIVPVIHCDFLSMYPTVCTLTGLWEFVRANGITQCDHTAAIRERLAAPREALVERLRHKNGWTDLAALVQVLPHRDLFPVRAQYPESETTNIGLNYLSADEPQWFTLADVLVSKILTGKTPEVLAAIRFTPQEKQQGLMPIEVEGQTIDPATDDFYQRLIIHRNNIKAKLKAADDHDKPALKSAEQGVKILANATSYGIFVELNVEDYRTAKPMIGYGARPRPFKFKSKKYEKPGRYFHPLLATLITGAARLMLALAEHQVVAQDLDWAFCDTDSIAIANTRELPLETFEAKARSVRDWFTDLNPYGEDRSILQLEDVNFPPDKPGDLDALDPPQCIAVSAKRYALFNRHDHTVVIRKASGHGLGHLMAPYDEPQLERRERIERIGVPLWEEDLWKEIIRAALTDTPDQTRFIEMSEIDVPAGSQYAAATPELLRWFDGYNARRPKGERVFPFGFLLSLQAKSRLEMAKDNPEALSNELWRRREPRPAAPYFKRPIDAKDHAFDRERDIKIPASWLKSLGRSLTRYHLHQETKFWGGEYDQRGALRRRHVFALTHQPIGKEADHIEESEFIGEDAGPQEYPLAANNRRRLLALITDIQKRYKISDRILIDRAAVSHHTLLALREGKKIHDGSLVRLVRAAEALDKEAHSASDNSGRWLKILRERRDQAGSRNNLAMQLGVNGPYLGRILRGEKPITADIIGRLKTLVTTR